MDGVDVELLYYAAREAGNAYAIVQEAKERVLSPTPPGRLGFRVQATLSLPHDDWKLSVSFLHYHGRTTEEEREGSYQPTLGHPLRLSDNVAESVRCRWRLHMGYLDGMLAKEWCTSSAFSITPMMGLRFAGVRHKGRVDYRIGSREEDLSMKNKFWGVGPLTGASLLFSIIDGFGIYAKGSCGLLFGEFYVHQDEEDAPGSRFKLFNEFNQCVQTVDGSIGFDLYRCFDLLLVSGRIGFDVHLLRDQNVAIRFLDGRMPGKYFDHLGDLALYGLSLRLGFAF